MRLDLSVYSLLLAAGLGAAYWASLATDETGDEEKVQIVSLDADSITDLTLTTKDPVSGTTIEATAKRADGRSRLWLTHTKTETPKQPPDKTAPDVATEPKVTTERFQANEKMDELLKAFEPFVAARVIGKVDGQQLAEFGLQAATDRLTVKTSDGKSMALLLGKKSYGSSNRFVREADGQGRVLLVDDQIIDNLQRAPMRLFDRRLVSFDFGDTTRAAVKAGNQAKTLAHTLRNKTGELLWTEEEEKPQPKPSLDSWMDKIAKLRLTTYAEAADESALVSVAPFLEITFEKDGKVLDTIKLKKAPGEPVVYWVISDFLGVHAKLPQARVEPIEKDLSSVFTDTKS